VVRPENIAAVRTAIPKNVRVIEFINVLDSSAKHFLREVFTDLASRPRDLDGRVATSSSASRRKVGVRRQVDSTTTPRGGV
jgi:hypothetical protein